MSSRAVHSRNSYRDVNKNEDDFDSDSSTPDRFKNQININTSRSPSNGNHICDSKSNCNNININVSSTISNSYSHSCSHSYSHSHSHSHSQGNYQKKTLFQSKAQKHHPQQSNSTATLSLDDSRGDWSTGSIHVSKLTESGNRFRMIPSDSTKNSTTTTTTTASTSNHVNDNRSRGHGIPYASESGNVYSTNHAHSHGNVDYRTRNQSLASRSTVYHDAADVEERLHMHSEYNYQEYPCDATSQSNHYYPRHCEYEYGHGHGYMPESMNELSMPMQSQMQTNRQTSIQTPYDFNTPSKFATILAPDNKSIWYRLKEIFEGKEDACNPTEIPDGLFCNCIKAVNDSPDTPDWNQNGWFMNGNGNRNRSGNGSGNPSYKSYSESSDCNYDEAVVQHHYMSFKDVDVDADVDVDVEQRSSSSHHSSKWNPINGNIKTVKRKNSNVVSNRQSDIDHGNAYRLPRHNVSHELEHKLEHKHKHEHELEQGYSLVNLGEVVNLSPEDFDSNQYQYDTFSKYTPLNTERESRRRLFSVPGGLYASEDDSPDSIPPIESPMSDMASVYHIANDLDSYAGDADTVTNLDIRDRFNSDFYSLPGNTELKHDDVPEFNPIRATMEKKGPARLHIDNSTDKKNNYNYSGMNNINTISSKPRLGNRQSSTVVNPASPISPMNTIGTQGTMHRRVNSTCTFTVNSFALIFDQNEQSPKKSTKIPIVPKTVKTVKKKSRNGNDGFDDISPLDDNEDSRLGLRSFRERMNEIDCAIDDDAACSPIQRQKQKSFDFSQNPIAVDLFGKENADPKTGISTYKSMASSNLCGNAVEKTLPEVHIANDPDGVYLPVTSFFKEEENPKHSECSFEGWVAYSKQTQSKDGLIQYIQQKNKLKRKHLRYIIVRGDQMYVHASKSSSEESVAGSSYTDDSKSTHMKVLKLSKHMSIEVKDVSRQHGKSIIVKDSRLIGMRKSDIVCTMLPVRLTSAFFKDESCSEVVGSREFDLALETTKMFGQKAACSRPPLLPANGVKECITPHPHNKSNMKAAEWPRTLSETVPIEQNTAALFMQFALDAAMRGKVSSKNS